MKRRKFLGLGVLGLVGVKPLVASAAVGGIDGSVKNSVHTLAEAKQLMSRIAPGGLPEVCGLGGRMVVLRRWEGGVLLK